MWNELWMVPYKWAIVKCDLCCLQFNECVTNCINAFWVKHFVLLCIFFNFEVQKQHNHLQTVWKAWMDENVRRPLDTSWRLFKESVYPNSHTKIKAFVTYLEAPDSTGFICQGFRSEEWESEMWGCLARESQEVEEGRLGNLCQSLNKVFHLVSLRKSHM